MIIESAYVTGSLDLIPLSQDNTESKILVVDNEGRVKYKESQNLLYNPISRYVSGISESITTYITSISDLHINIPWQRTGSVLALTHSNHNLQVDDLVIVRNTYTDFITGSITTRTNNDFLVEVGGNEPTLITGSLGIYSGGFKTTCTTTINIINSQYSSSFNITAPSNTGSSYIKIKEISAVKNNNLNVTTWSFNLPSAPVFNNEENSDFFNYTHPITQFIRGGSSGLYLPLTNLVPAGANPNVYRVIQASGSNLSTVISTFNIPQQCIVKLIYL
jgi:hypothetical protein